MRLPRHSRRRYMNLRPYPPLLINRRRPALTPELLRADEMREALMAEIRYRLSNMTPYERKVLARRISRTPSCITAILTGKTRWPQWDTLFQMVPALELEIQMSPVTLEGVT